MYITQLSYLYPSAGEARGLKMKTRFSGTEIFRKYLWYLLRERSFDADAVADMQQLKSSLGLTDEEVHTLGMMTIRTGLTFIWMLGCGGHAAAQDRAGPDRCRGQRCCNV